MSGPRENERRYERYQSDVDAALLDESGGVIDGSAQAKDISAAGFRVETRAKLNVGQKVRFELTFGDGETARGEGKVIWASADPWGGYAAGLKIKMSWRESSKLRQRVYRQGYDFVALARKMFWGLYWIIVFAALQNVLLHQATRDVVASLIPVVLALAVLGWSLLLLLR